MSRRIVSLSLGAGVQSSTVALMCSRGELPYRVDFAVFADTQQEPKEVYRWLDWLEKQLTFPVLRVTAGDLGADSLRLRKSKKSGKIYLRNLIPMFIQNPDGSKGIIGRKCTAEYKVRQIIAAMRGEVTQKAIHRWRKENGVVSYAVEGSKKRRWEVPEGTEPLVTCLIGISWDEVERMKVSPEPWIENKWPLVDVKMTREDCLTWMQKNGFPRPPRSACTFCPYHSDAEWLRMRDTDPESFASAVEWERQMHARSKRDQAMRGVPFLHASLKPLPLVAFKDAGPAFGNECEGMCGN